MVNRCLYGSLQIIPPQEATKDMLASVRTVRVSFESLIISHTLVCQSLGQQPRRDLCLELEHVTTGSARLGAFHVVL